MEVAKSSTQPLPQLLLSREGNVRRKSAFAGCTRTSFFETGIIFFWFLGLPIWASSLRAEKFLRLSLPDRCLTSPVLLESFSAKAKNDSLPLSTERFFIHTIFTSSSNIIPNALRIFSFILFLKLSKSSNDPPPLFISTRALCSYTPILFSA